MSALARADAFARWWVDRYTAALRTPVAERRRAEVRSDLWEQQTWAAAAGTTPGRVAMSIVRRVVAGIAADLWWRRAQLATARVRQQSPGVQMWSSLRRTWWQALAVLVAGIEIGTGVYAPFEDPPGTAVDSVVLTTAGVAILVGLVVRRRRQGRGDLMVAVGVLPVVPWYWTYVFPIAAVAVLSATLVDAADARSSSEATAATPPGTPPQAADHVRSLLIAAVTAALVGGVAVGSASATVVLVSPLVALLIAHALVRGRTDLTPPARAGLILVAAGVGNVVLTFVAVAIDDFVLATATVVTAAVGVAALALLAGVALLTLARTSTRWS